MNEESHRGLAVSLYTFILFIGASIGALMPTWLIDMDISTFYGLTAGFLLIGAIENIPVLTGVFKREGKSDGK